MILGNPTPQDDLEIVQEEGCSACGEIPSHISVEGPDAIVPSCGHVIDAKEWIESRYVEQDRETSVSGYKHA